MNIQDFLSGFGLAFVIWLVPSLRSAFKVGYYEQTLRNHRSKFSEGRWAKIEDVMNRPWWKL